MLNLQILRSLIKVTKTIFGERVGGALLDIYTSKETLFYIDENYDFQKNKTLPRLTIFLPARGCEWALKTGGCTMCGLGKRAREMGKKFSSEDLIILYEIANILTQKFQPLSLNIYNGGSFFNSCEISHEVQLEICRKVYKHPYIQRLLLESRVEFITPSKIRAVKDILKEKVLTVAIGLEAENDKVRNVYIRKGLTKESYERAINLLKGNGVRVLTYVFIKPIYLNEKEAIEEAVRSVKYAFEAGSDEVALEAACIQEGSLMAKLFKEDKFKPPWLWSVIEVIKQTYDLGPVQIGSFEDQPLPIATPMNCSVCSSKIKNLLQLYRETHDINLLNNLKCSCQKLWKDEIEVKAQKV